MVLGRSWGTRILQLAYIGFALIVVSNYTANLAGTLQAIYTTKFIFIHPSAAYTARRIQFSVASFNDLARTKQKFASTSSSNVPSDMYSDERHVGTAVCAALPRTGGQHGGL